VKTQTPTHGQENDLRFKLSPLEQTGNRGCEKHRPNLSASSTKIATLPFCVAFSIAGTVASELEDAIKIPPGFSRIRQRLLELAFTNLAVDLGKLGLGFGSPGYRTYCDGEY
jgi:hypothetical protein